LHHGPPGGQRESVINLRNRTYPPTNVIERPQRLTSPGTRTRPRSTWQDSLPSAPLRSMMPCAASYPSCALVSPSCTWTTVRVSYSTWWASSAPPDTTPYKLNNAVPFFVQTECVITSRRTPCGSGKSFEMPSLRAFQQHCNNRIVAPV